MNWVSFNQELNFKFNDTQFIDFYFLQNQTSTCKNASFESHVRHAICTTPKKLCKNLLSIVNSKFFYKYTLFLHTKRILSVCNSRCLVFCVNLGIRIFVHRFVKLSFLLSLNFLFSIRPFQLIG